MNFGSHIAVPAFNALKSISNVGLDTIYSVYDYVSNYGNSNVALDHAKVPLVSNDITKIGNFINEIDENLESAIRMQEVIDESNENTNKFLPPKAVTNNTLPNLPSTVSLATVPSTKSPPNFKPTNEDTQSKSFSNSSELQPVYSNNTSISTQYELKKNLLSFVRDTDPEVRTNALEHISNTFLETDEMIPRAILLGLCNTTLVKAALHEPFKILSHSYNLLPVQLKSIVENWYNLTDPLRREQLTYYQSEGTESFPLSVAVKDSTETSMLLLACIAAVCGCIVWYKQRMTQGVPTALEDYTPSDQDSDLEDSAEARTPPINLTNYSISDSLDLDNDYDSDEYYESDYQRQNNQIQDKIEDLKDLESEIIEMNISTMDREKLIRYSQRLIERLKESKESKSLHNAMHQIDILTVVNEELKNRNTAL